MKAVGSSSIKKMADVSEGCGQQRQ